MRDRLRRAFVAWLRIVGETGERVAETTTSVLRRLGEQPDGGTERAVVAAITAQVREILDLPPPEGEVSSAVGTADTELLRRRFSELLDRSRALDPPPGTHPAFQRIVDEISPDEARIIRFLHEEGPQPVVHLAARPLIGSGGSTVLENLSMIGDRAGCHTPDLTPSYLENLIRLGVVKLHDEELVGHEDYELIEVRADFADAVEEIEEVRRQRPKSQRWSVRLTALGSEFCGVCLPRTGA